MGDFQNLKNQAAVIRDEQQDYKNTALRIGKMFIDMLEQLENVLPDENVQPDTLTVEPTETSYKLKFSTITSDGTIKSREVSLPLATETKAGIMSPALLKSVKDQIADLASKTVYNTYIDITTIKNGTLITEEQQKELERIFAATVPVYLQNVGFYEKTTNGLWTKTLVLRKESATYVADVTSTIWSIVIIKTDKELNGESYNPIANAPVQQAITSLSSKVDTQLPAIEEAKNEAIESINQNEQSAISNFNAQRVTPEMLSESTKQLIEASGGGTITNLPDDEDLESVDDGTGTKVIRLRNKAYSAENFSGLGRVYLRKNMVDEKNVLTQEMISKSNIIYHIQYDYSLDGAEINIPDKCVLNFDGGSLSNGTLVFNSTRLSGDVRIFTNISGTVSNNNIDVEWFDNGKLDYFTLFKQLGSIVSDQSITFSKKNYPIAFPDNQSSCLLLNKKSNISVYGNNCSIIVGSNEYPKYNVIDIQDCNGFYVSDINIIGDRLTHSYTESGGTHEFGYGIYVHTTLPADSGKKLMNGMISNCTISQMTGDGIILKNGYAGGRIDVNKCEIHHCRRQGISVLDCDEVYIDGVNIHEIGTFDGVDGARPACGIDLEPASGTLTITSFNVKNCTIHNTMGWGVVNARSMSDSRVNIYDSDINSIVCTQELKSFDIVRCNIGAPESEIENESWADDTGVNIPYANIRDCNIYNIHGRYIYLNGANNCIIRGMVDKGVITDIRCKDGMPLKQCAIENAAIKYSRNVMVAPEMINCRLDGIKFIIEDSQDKHRMINCVLEKCSSDNTYPVTLIGCTLDTKINQESVYQQCIIIDELVE